MSWWFVMLTIWSSLSLDIYSDTFILYLYFLYIFIFPCQGLDLIENNFIWFYMFVIDEEREEKLHGKLSEFSLFLISWNDFILFQRRKLLKLLTNFCVICGVQFFYFCLSPVNNDIEVVARLALPDHSLAVLEWGRLQGVCHRQSLPLVQVLWTHKIFLIKRNKEKSREENSLIFMNRIARQGYI